MAVKLDLQWAKAQLEGVRADRVEAALVRAARNAGDQAGRAWRTAAIELLRRRRGLRAGFLRSRIRLQRPSAGANLSALEWRLHVDGASIAMGQYPVRQTPRGVLVKLGPKSAEIRGAFILQVGGHTVVARRRGKARRPTYEQFSKRLSDVVQEEGGVDQLADAFRRRFEDAFTVQIEAQIAKLGR